MATTDGRPKPMVKDLHEHIVCPLCRGYLIDATTLVECLHSFCRGCIVRRLGSGARACPVCGALTLPPLLPDLALQRLVYLAVPGLYRSELDRRRHFRLVNPQCPPPAPPQGALALTLEDAVSLSLSEILHNEEDPELRSGKNTRLNEDEDNDYSNKRQIRYLKCPAGVTVRHLVRLLALKRGWGDTEGKLPLKRIEMMYENRTDDNDKPEMRPLQLSWTLLDLACIFKWDKETPMKLYYRVVKRDETILQPPAISTYNVVCNGVINPGGGNSNTIMENVQRPPTPPPSPKQSANTDIRAPPQPQQRINEESKPKSNANAKPEPEPETGPDEIETQPESVETEQPTPVALSLPCGNQDIVGCAEVNASSQSTESHGMKVKKPRCEVTPVMRAPGPQGSCGISGDSNKTSKSPRMEHHKRRKRRNKRLIAEITTTPREDLLKLKVRLTPCPPRITSSTGSAKEKLLQMRAVRREKIKNNPERTQTPPPTIKVTIPTSAPEMILTPPPSASADDVKTLQPIIAVEETATDKQKSKEISTEQEETIEEIIDGIPDEVVRVAQNMNCPQAASAATNEDKILQSVIGIGGLELKRKEEKKMEDNKKLPEVEIIRISGTEEEEEEEEDEEEEEKFIEKPKKDEEVLRRLGLVAISEASKTLQDKMRGLKNKSGNGSGGIDYHRESLERQLRESKANRVRSLLAEKQMRDALKSIMSKSKPKGSGNGPKKGPPPLAPLTPKQGFSNPPKSSHPVTNNPQISSRVSAGSGITGKNEKPLDLSSGAHNALDLSPTPSSSSNPVITSTTFSSPVKSRGKTINSGQVKSPEDKKNQDLNLRTLSDAAVSLLSTSPAAATGGGAGGEVRITNSTILSNKVALRIPQPHQRLSGFGNGMKIKPNLAVRHIPNPQAFVASQYRNQRTNFFTAQQQPP